MLHESGKRIRWRPEIGHGGNKRLRTALYLATLNVVRFNPVIREFYERLITAGKTKSSMLRGGTEVVADRVGGCAFRGTV